ncbi:hypothetical protein [Microbacterium excoecariae]|uniref:hypothetical protein n=1 Tax=Microbacterium excoecariae TaxID=2715210 RepID=UPI0014092F97|nr:hypothetical protein [Microbacterium excoecariae]NHI16068.1 hypothetical protein [Microbacterium excoecariae]
MPAGSDERRRARRPPSPALRAIAGVVALAMLAGAIAVGFLSLYREFWGPSAFAERYVRAIADADAQAALAIPGVAPEFSALEDIGRGYASDALLRADALASTITDVHAVAEAPLPTDEGEVTVVTVAYTIDGVRDEMVFRVERAGMSGLVPAWRFETSPLSVLDVTVRGSWQFAVNGFEIDKRQIAPEGVEADPLAPVTMLTFSPGNYAIAVDTAATQADPRTVRSASLLDRVAIDIQTTPTDELTQVVEDSVADFLETTCTTQAVLQPQDCPFSYDASWGIAQPDISWTILDYPRTALVPDGDDWRVSPTSGRAHVTLTVQDYFTGALVPVDEDVYFTMVAEVDVGDDGSVHITIDRAT